ncbi:MAG: hypothetical protein JRN57_04260 [Nitrososphaerota archaeon]|nr:hypothetical protein [Nitrososphaerota archaeon]
MRFSSLEHFGLSAWRLACVGIASASGGWLLGDLVLGGVLGQAKPGILLIISALVFYLVVSVPRRMLDGRRVSEAREAVPLSASARACLEVTGSRPRTLMMVRPREPSLARSLEAAARMVLLGTRVEDALAHAAEGLASYSSAATLRSLAVLRPEGFESGDEEARGLAASGDLSRETKVPMFMTVCFFAPILTLLYAVFSHSYSAASMSELTALEFIIVDLTYYMSSARGGER